MEIIRTRAPTPGMAANAVCTFDVQLTPHVRALHLKVIRNLNGELRVRSPKAFDDSVLHFSSEMNDRMAAMAIEAFKKGNALDRRAA